MDEFWFNRGNLGMGIDDFNVVLFVKIIYICAKSFIFGCMLMLESDLC